jgi:hypothetical protein
VLGCGIEHPAQVLEIVDVPDAVDRVGGHGERANVDARHAGIIAGNGVRVLYQRWQTVSAADAFGEAHQPPASQAGGALAFQGAFVAFGAIFRQSAGHPLDAALGGC